MDAEVDIAPKRTQSATSEKSESTALTKNKYRKRMAEELAKQEYGAYLNKALGTAPGENGIRVDHIIAATREGDKQRTSHYRNTHH